MELSEYFKMELGEHFKYWYKVFNYQQIVKSTYFILRYTFLLAIFSILNTTVLDVDMYARHQTSNCTGIPNGAGEHAFVTNYKYVLLGDLKPQVPLRFRK